jgi:hypothetical protein
MISRSPLLLSDAACFLEEVLHWVIITTKNPAVMTEILFIIKIFIAEINI